MRASREFEPNPAQVQLARRFLSAAVRSWGLEPGDAVLLVSELATNAVLHARSPFRVTVVQRGARLRVEVSDESSRLPSLSLAPPGAGRSHGRGLALVEALSGAWGVDSHLGEGKTVWFEVPLEHGGRPRASRPGERRAAAGTRPLRRA